MFSKLWIIALALLPLAVMNAQETTPVDTLGEELIISHSRIPVSTKSSYKPLIVIDQEEIRREPTDDLSILLDRQVGLNVVSALSNPAKDKSIFLQGASGEFTLILIDGVPLTDPSGIGGTFDIRSISLAQIEKIEILKGGQSTLYGSDAIAGVINLITKSGRKEAINGQINASIGSYSTQNVGGSLNMPFSDAINLNIDGSYASSDGVSEALDENGTGFDKDGFDRTAFSANIDWKLTDQITIKPFLRSSSFDGDFDGGSFTDSEDTYTTDWLQTGLFAKYQANKTTINATYSFNKTDRTFDTSFGISDFNGRFNNLDIYGHTPLNDQLHLTFGINQQSFKTIEEDPNIDDADASIWSPYASLAFRPNLSTLLELGVRFNNHSDYGSNFNYSLGASNWLSDNVKVFAYWATSFKSPNLFQLFGQFGANPDLNPQTGRTLNAGLSFKVAGPFDLIDLTVFDRTVDNLIIFDFNDGFQNVPSQHDQGLEISLSSSSDLIQFGISYAYLFGELDDLSGSNPVENLIRRPKHRINTSIGYKYRNNNQILFSMKYAGEREDAFFNTTTFATDMVTLESYWIGNLYGDYTLDSPNITFYGEVKNIFDTDFQEVAGFTTLGRNVNVGLRLNF